MNLANVAPLSYEAKFLKFKRQPDVDAYITVHKNDKNLLCYKEESEEFEGKGTIYIQITNSINNVDKAINLLAHELKRIGATKENYLITYSPMPGKETTYRCRVNTSRFFYEKISNPLFRKTPWSFNEKEFVFYWKK